MFLPLFRILTDIYVDVDAKILARGTPGFSGADLQNMVKYVFSPPTVNVNLV